MTSKLLSEMETQLGGQPPTPADLERLPYLEQVVKEVLRIYPPAASLSRIAREQFEKHTPGAYLPFGAGPRTCLGAPFAMMELKTVLVMLLQRSRLDVIADQRVEATVRTTLQPKYGLRMRPQLQDGHTERSPARVLGNVVGAVPESL